jgi:hypothetical protein
MTDEVDLNLGYLNNKINFKKDFNYKYKKSYEREDDIITGECILNYLSENQYTKPFIKENYMMKSNDKPYFQKLNINNYQQRLGDKINKEKNKQIPLEDSIIKRILDILYKKDEKKNSLNFKLERNNVKKQLINENKPSYLNTEGNKENKNSFFEKYLLPKIDFKKDNYQKLNEDNKNSFDSNKGIFKNTSINKTIEMEENEFRNKIFKNPINFYSPCLKRNIMPIFRNINGRHCISVKKGKILNDELSRIHDKKFSIKSYSTKKNNKDKQNEIKNVKIFDKKYHLINLFKDIGKIKSPREIEKTLFSEDEKRYKILKSKNFLMNNIKK